MDFYFRTSGIFYKATTEYPRDVRKCKEDAIKDWRRAFPEFETKLLNWLHSNNIEKFEMNLVTCLVDNYAPRHYLWKVSIPDEDEALMFKLGFS